MMAASLKKVTVKQAITSCSVDNVELTELVKLAAGEAIKEAMPPLVEDVVAQLTTKMQALLDDQVGVFRVRWMP